MACEGKIKFTHSRAVFVSKNRRNRKKKKSMTVYFCLECKGWHITTSPFHHIDNKKSYTDKNREENFE